MVSDPYKVLGVSRDATPEEIKKAYRQMARKYHPDMHPNDPNATAKMNEINEAYDMINNPEKYAKAQAQQQRNSYNQNSGYGSGYSGYSSGNSGYGYGGYGSDSSQNSNGYNGSYGGQYGWSSNFDFEDFFYGYGRQTHKERKNPTVESGDSQTIKTAINYINTGYYQNAINTLSSVASPQRDARWYYLCSLAYYGGQDMTHAVDFMQKATQMEPNNEKYQNLLKEFMQTSRSESSRTTYTRKSSSLLRLFVPIIIIILFNYLIFGGSCLGCSSGSGCFGCFGSNYKNYYNNYGYGSYYGDNYDQSGSDSQDDTNSNSNDSTNSGSGRNPYSYGLW